MLHRITCTLLTLAVLAAQQPAPSSRAVDLLLGKARSLESRGRIDLAAQTWQQLLMIEPEQPEAIAGLARAAKVQGKQAEAQTYLDKLRKANPANPAIKQIEAIGKTEKRNPLLDEAAKLAGSGQSDKAVAAYRKAFGGKTPPAEWAIPYYETMAGTPEGWEEATAALEEVSRKNPGAPEYKLSLGRLYTYRPATRLKGLAMLESVTGPSAAQARPAWRQALVWENGSSRAAESLRAYLGRYPEAELEVLSKKQPPAPVQTAAGGVDVRRAYQALKNEDAGGAQGLFEEALRKNPKQSDALAGLGFVQMKQQDFSGALRSFEAAAAIAPDNRAIRDGYKEARFWVTMRDGAAALKNKRSEEAVSAFKKALAERPNHPLATESYAGALMQHGDYAVALPILERLAKADSSRLQTWKDIVTAKQQLSGAQAALDAANQIPALAAAKLNSDLDYLAALAGIQQRAGYTSDATKTFTKAAALAEKSRSELPVDVEMQLGSLYGNFGNAAYAVKHYRAAIQRAPENLDAWEGFMLASNRAKSAGQALQTLEGLPASVHEAAQARPSFLRAVATLEASIGRLDSAQSLLDKAQQIESADGKDPSLFTQVQTAQLWLQQGKGGVAAQKFAELTQAFPDNPEVWKGLVSGLHQSGAFDQAAETIHRIPPAVASALGGDPDYVGTAASLYKETGTNEDAVRFLREATARFVAEGRTIPPALTVQTGWLLLNQPGSERELFNLLRNARTRTDFPVAERKALNDIWTAWLTRSADTARINGDPKHAVAILEAGIRMMPEELRLQRALAAAVLTAGEAKRATAIYQTAGLRGAPATEYVGAIGAAMAAEETRLADAWLKEALTRYPADTELLSLAGKQAAAKGDFKKAEGFWRLALRGVEAQAQERVAEGLRTGPEGIPDLKTGNPTDDAGMVLLSKAQSQESADPAARTTVTYRLPWAIQPATSEMPATQQAAAPTKKLAEEPILISSLTGAVTQEASAKPAGQTTKDSLNRMLQALETRESRSELKRSLEKEPTQASGNPVTLPKPARIEDLLPSATPNTSLAMLLEPRATDSRAPESEKIMDRIQAMESRNSPYLGLGGKVVSRTGQAGFEKMMLQESTLESSTVVAGGLRATILARSVFADSTGPDGESLYRFGMLPQGDTFAGPSVNGFGAEAQLSGQNFGLRFGSTPRGFPVRNVIGGARFRPGGGPITLSFDRDSVKDTILSYAGAQDPISRRVWGGVIANSGNATANFGDEKSGVYFNFGFHHLTGQSVQTNRRIDGTLGTYWRLVHTPVGSLNAGLNLFAMSYSKNLRYFTVGHGGYFSPQRFLLFNVPITWSGKTRRLEYTVGTSIGSQSFTEDSSAYFPLDPLVQGKTGPYYPKLSSSGVNYNVDFRTAYQIAENWFLVGYLNVNNARFFSQQSAGISIKYSFRPRPLGADLMVPSVPDWRGNQPFGLQ